MILTRQILANNAASDWWAQYNRFFSEYLDKQAIHDKLVALGQNPSPADVDRVIGNTNWTELTCRQCDRDVDAIAIFGDVDSGPVYVCEACLRAALEEFKK